MIEQHAAAFLDAVTLPLGNLSVLVEAEHPAGLLGLWQRHAWGGCTVTLYEAAIVAEAGDGDLAAVVGRVLAHELGHHFGMTDGQLARA